jgi:hypothetical protein
MRLKNYLVETIMPKEQLDYFKKLRNEFLADNKGYKFTTIEKFMKDLEKNDYKSLSVLFGDLNITSITQFIKKYKSEIERINEAIDWNKDWSSPEKKAIKAKYDKILKIVSAKAQYGKTEYIVELIGDKWPKEFDIIKFCDVDADFGGKVQDSADNKKQKYVYINNS